MVARKFFVEKSPLVSRKVSIAPRLEEKKPEATSERTGGRATGTLRTRSRKLETLGRTMGRQKMMSVPDFGSISAAMTQFWSATFDTLQTPIFLSFESQLTRSKSRENLARLTQTGEGLVFILRRSVVGTPYNATHEVHVEYDASLGEYKGLPEEWKNIVQFSPSVYNQDQAQEYSFCKRSLGSVTSQIRSPRRTTSTS